jgi:hypothetical protein
MSISIHDLRKHLMDLPLEARTELAYEVLDNMTDDDLDEDPAEVEAAWDEEIKRRVDEIRNETGETYALEDVLAEMEERYG